MKKCVDCKQLKPIEEFIINSKTRKNFQRSHCKSCNTLRSRAYRVQHPDKIKKYENKKSRKDYLKSYKESYNKTYYESNKDAIIKQHITYEKHKYNTNLEFRILRNLRNRFRITTQQKAISRKTREYLGCTLEEFKKHLESQFLEGMSWENYGRKFNNWSIDHILPCSSFDLTKEDEIKKCFHYTNCRPLWVIDNSSKGCKLIPSGS